MEFLINLFMKLFKKFRNNEKVAKVIDGDYAIKKDDNADMPSIEDLKKDRTKSKFASLTKYYNYYTPNERLEIMKMFYRDEVHNFEDPLSEWFSKNRKNDESLRKLILTAIMTSYDYRSSEYKLQYFIKYNGIKLDEITYICDNFKNISYIEDFLKALKEAKVKIQHENLVKLINLIKNEYENDFDSRNVMAGYCCSIYNNSPYDDIKEQMVEWIIEDCGKHQKYIDRAKQWNMSDTNIANPENAVYNIIQNKDSEIGQKYRKRLIETLLKHQTYRADDLFNESQDKNERLELLKVIITNTYWKATSLLKYHKVYSKEFQMIAKAVVDNADMETAEFIFKTYNAELSKFPAEKDKIEALLLAQKLVS